MVVALVKERQVKVKEVQMKMNYYSMDNKSEQMVYYQVHQFIFK